MKSVCLVLGVARSNLHVRHHRCGDWQDGRSGRTPAQVVLRWHIQHGLVAIPRSSHPQRIAENLDIFDFELSDEQMELIDSMDESEPS